MSAPIEAWNALSKPWQAAFDEAWASCRLGSLGVGAVITDEHGDIVARGHNQFFHKGPGPIAETYMAHAEMNAYIQLPIGRATRYVLYSTFEPCSMCAVVGGHYRMTHVHYASPDPLFHGLGDWLDSAPWAERHYGPRSVLGGPVGALGYALHVWRIIEAGWPLSLKTAHELHAAALYRVVSQEATLETLRQLAAEEVPTPTVLATMWPFLEHALS